MSRILGSTVYDDDLSTRYSFHLSIDMFQTAVKGQGILHRVEFEVDQLTVII